MKLICTNCKIEKESTYGDGKFVFFPNGRGRLCKDCYKKYEEDLFLLDIKYGLTKYNGEKI